MEDKRLPLMAEHIRQAKKENPDFKKYVIFTDKPVIDLASEMCKGQTVADLAKGEIPLQAPPPEKLPADKYY